MKLGSDLLWLSESDVASLLTMDEALEAVGEAFRLHGEGKVQMPPKVYLQFEPFDGDLRAMPAYLPPPFKAAGVKIVNSTPSNPEKGLPAVTGIMTVVDPETALPIGVFAAGTLTSMRTGAAGGLAAQHLARPDARVVGLVGCGRQARTQVKALLVRFKLSEMRVWGKTEKEVADFANDMASTGVKITACPDIASACRADIVVTTTPARTPVVKKEWIAPGTHINAIGADAPGKQELDIDLLKASRVVVDEWHQASHAGEINVAVSRHGYGPGDLAGTLGEIVTGRKKGRTSPADITVFDSTGLAIQDVAVARVLYEKAIKLKKGQVLKLNG